MSRRIIDLSMPCSNATDGFSVRLQDNLPVYFDRECYAYDLEISSHRGTYFETPAHVFRERMNTDQFPLEKLIVPGFCLRVAQTQRCITAADLDAADGADLPPGSALLVDVGDRPEHYFSRDAAAWMAQHGVTLMGSNARLYDCGFENPTGFFVELFQADIPIVANLTSFAHLPRTGFTLIVLPLSIQGVCTVPCRAVAMLDR